jgi:hypothetical protein
MKMLTILSFFAFATSAFAAETIGEKVEVKAHDAKRSIKQVTHKGEELVCDKTSKNCFAKKVDHRTDDAKDYVKDKASEGKNIIDNDKKK